MSSFIPRSSWWAPRASSSPVGPQANVVRSCRSGTRSVEVGHVEHAVLVVVAGDEIDHPGLVELAKVADEDRVGFARRDVHDGDVVGLAAREAHHPGVGDREQVAQHPDHRRDTGPGGDEEELAAVGGQHELAGRLLEVHESADLGAVHQVVADLALRHGLDRDRDAAVAAGTVRQGVGAPQADAVDVDADPEVLARDVPGPVRTRTDHDGGGVGGLGVDLLDAAAQVRARAQGVEHVEVVGWNQRGRGELHDASYAFAQSPAERERTPRAVGGVGRGGHDSRVVCIRGKVMTGARESNAPFCSQRMKHGPTTPVAPHQAHDHRAAQGCPDRCGADRGGDHRGRSELLRRPERQDGRDHPQRGGAGPGRLHLAGRALARW